ncbi:hypothetical protein NYZ99_16645 [Maribacter litopenaei]|uniref:Uncharacterized protein n=1 Tax=Maribacter litopenaei TaxID=2976127 RepID=A0ABY5Y756_9FLAO|nr:hypothetical protein [Maribacter litopenaei]UWX54519.1 hypothetical protein NYZ99_16645 [Maribacter litopenaei]
MNNIRKGEAKSEQMPMAEGFQTNGFGVILELAQARTKLLRTPNFQRSF